MTFLGVLLKVPLDLLPPLVLAGAKELGGEVELLAWPVGAIQTRKNEFKISRQLWPIENVC